MEQDIISNYNCPVKPKYCPVCRLNYNGKYEECPLCKKKEKSTAINQGIRERQKTMTEKVRKENGKKISERRKENEFTKEEREKMIKECNQEYRERKKGKQA